MEKTVIQGRDEPGLWPRIGEKTSSVSGKEIYLLINHGYYYLNYVFIMVERIGYRLVVIHAGHVKTNKCYSSLRGAKIAFARMYNRKAWGKGVKPEWGPLYQPSSGWLDDKIKILKKYSRCRLTEIPNRSAGHPYNDLHETCMESRIN